MTNELHLWRTPGECAEDILEQYSYESDGISITTEFYRPPPPKGDGSWEMSTAPIARWVQTTIEGYTTAPLILQGFYSQTYHAGHHNIKEHFLFEPRLEPGMSQASLDELATQDIRLIHMIIDNWGSDSSIQTYSFDYLPGDFDNDKHVDFADFANLANRWSQTNCCSCDGADLTGDRQITFHDLRIMADNWLSTL
jgi:hypothetical protein